MAAALIHRAIGDQLTCVFVDHGLLRLDEGTMVMDMFAKNLSVKAIRIDAEDQFMGWVFRTSVTSDSGIVTSHSV